MNISVNVIIVNWNGKHHLKDCLEGLRRQTYTAFSTLLVDNGSTDGSVEFVERYFPEVRTIALKENTGFCKANNIAIRSVRSRYIALVNNDAVAHPHWLENLVRAMENNPAAGLAASKMLFWDNPGIIDRAGDAYSTAGTGLLRGRGASAGNYNRSEWIFGACAGAAIYRGEMLDDIGLFDEDFFLVYEDVDLSFRAQLRGYPCLYVPEAVVYHKASASIGADSPISVYYSHRNLEWVYLKNMPARLIVKTLFSHIVYDFASFLYFCVIGKGKCWIKAKRDVFAEWRGIIRKRKGIQSNKRVDDAYIYRLFAKELLLPRLIRRFRKK